MTIAALAKKWLKEAETEKKMADNVFKNIQSKVGQFLRANRQSRGYSLRAVAREMKLSAVFLSDLERGRRNWTPALIQAQSNAVNTIFSRTKP